MRTEHTEEHGDPEALSCHAYSQLDLSVSKVRKQRPTEHLHAVLWEWGDDALVVMRLMTPHGTFTGKVADQARTPSSAVNVAWT